MVRRASRPVRALFRVAAGPRIGFGHLVRARVLSRALGIDRPVVSLRGRHAPRKSALTLRMHPIAGPAADVMARLRPEILVIDDPSAAAARVWCETARRAGIPVASVHDLGTAFCGADLDDRRQYRPAAPTRRRGQAPGTFAGRRPLYRP